MIVSSTHLKIKHLHGNSAGCLTMSDKERLLCQQDSHFPMQCRVRKNGKVICMVKMVKDGQKGVCWSKWGKLVMMV